MSLIESRRPSLRDKIEAIEDEFVAKEKKANRKAKKPTKKGRVIKSKKVKKNEK